MLQYNEQYQILSAIQLSFLKNQGRLLHVSHSAKKIQDMKKFLSPRYESSTRQNFIIYALYTALRNNVTCLHDMFQIMSHYTEDDIKTMHTFKNDIVHHQMRIVKDIDIIYESIRSDELTKDVSISNINKFSTAHDLYVQGKIEYFTLYFFGVHLDVLDEVLSSRRYKKTILKIQNMFTYIEFKEETAKKILSLFERTFN